MNIKKFATSALIAICVSFSMPAFSSSIVPVTENPADGGKTKSTDPMVRLQEIKNMDMKHLSRAEKKELRKEVKRIKSQNGIYLSVGAIIIVILLLILLL